MERMKEHTTHTFRAKTSKQGYRLIEWALEFARTLWNDCLAECIDHRRKTGENMTRNGQINSLTWIRNNMPETGLKPYHSHFFHFIPDRIKDAFGRVAKGVGGFPKFKSRGRPVRSIEIRKNDFQIKPVGDSGRRHALCVMGLKPILFYADFDRIEGEIKQARIIMKATGLFVQLVEKYEADTQLVEGRMTGVDLGITHQVTTSTGLKLKKSARKTEQAKRHQRSLSRKKAGSNSRKKAKASLAKASEREATRMKGLAHEFTDFLIKTHGPWIAMEELQIKNMMKNRHLARSINDSLWGIIRNMLEYKCRRAGGRLILVDPRNTSKTCNACKEKRDSAPLGMRVFECDSCGHVACRDVNAACNIGDRGFEALDEKERKFVLGVGGTLPAGFADVDNSGVKAIIDFESMMATDLQGSQNRCLNAHLGI